MSKGTYNRKDLYFLNLFSILINVLVALETTKLIKNKLRLKH